VGVTLCTVSSASNLAPLAWSWRDSAIVRILGAAVSWFGFMLCFVLLYLTSHTVLSLGGYCASGGPYVIEVQCPENVLAFTPWNIFGGLLAVAISVFIAQGFGTPLVVWAWPLLFVGLSIPFFMAALGGDIVGIILGVMFFVMGIVPVWFFIKGGALSLALLGSRNARGQNFTGGENAKLAYRMIGRRPGADTDAVTPTSGDWALSTGITIVFGGLGIIVAQAWWAAVTAAAV
jgi:hypothetical protein